MGGVWSSERDFQLVKFYPVSLTFLEEGSGNGVFFRSEVRESWSLCKDSIPVFMLQGSQKKFKMAFFFI